MPRVQLTIEHRSGEWFIIGDPEVSLYGPYRTQKDAEEDRKGLERFYRRQDEPGFITTTNKEVKP